MSPPLKPLSSTRLRAIQSEQWHAVAIVSPSECCSLVESLRGKRFLPSEAPRLPLPDCTKPLRCQCVYRHFADRRAGPRPGGARFRLPADGDRRRHPRGRRVDD